MTDKKLLCTGILLSAGMIAAQAQKKQPNLIFVFADQLRADVLGYAGDSRAITPNIDRFASQSMDFTNAVSVSPVSAAYRSCLITGKYTSSTGMVINEVNMNPNHRTIAHVLGENGYDLGYVGKMHLNDKYARPYLKGPERFGFDGYWAVYSFNHDSYNAFYHHDIPDGTQEFVSLKGRYSPPVFTGLAMDYIRRAASGDKPFAAFLSWNPPHDPWTKANTDPKCYARFAGARFDLPENFKDTPDPYMDRYPKPFLANKTAWNQQWVAEGYQETMRCYYAMANSIDEQFGRVLSLVDSLGIADNTIIVFTSDHGEMFGSQGRMFKLTFYEEAARIPLLVRFPGMKGASTSDVLINTPDLMPTLLGAVGLGDKIPAEVEGMDLSHVLKGEKGDEPAFAFMQGMGHTHMWQDGFEWRSVRDGRFTYARYLRDGSEVLFDRRNDPHEMKNLAGDKKYAKELKKYRDAMAGKMKELNDQFKPCTWYRDNWMYKTFSIKAAARGEFGPLPPVEPLRKPAK